MSLLPIPVDVITPELVESPNCCGTNIPLFIMAIIHGSKLRVQILADPFSIILDYKFNTLLSNSFLPSTKILKGLQSANVGAR